MLLSRGVEGDRDEIAAVDLKQAHATGGPVEGRGGEVNVATDLVLELELIGVVVAPVEWGTWYQQCHPAMSFSSVGCRPK